MSSLSSECYFGLLVTSSRWSTDLDSYSDVSVECGKP